MNSTNLLQHQINKFGVITVMDVLLLDIETNQPVLFLDTLKVTSLTQEGESKDIRGGIGAPELISYDFARTVTLEIQDALASMGSLEMLWGGKEYGDKDEEGNVINVDYTAMFEAKVNKTGDEGAEVYTITIPKDITVEPDKEKEILILDKENNTSYVPKKAEGFIITLDDGDEPADGTIVKVFLPATAAKAHGAMAIAINSIDVPPTVKLVGQTFFIDQATGKKIPMQLEVPKFKINIGGGMAMEAEGDAAVFDFNGKAMADDNKNFFILKQLGAPGYEKGDDFFGDPKFPELEGE